MVIFGLKTGQTKGFILQQNLIQIINLNLK